MTINLPADLETSVRAAVLSGHFANEDDVVARIVRDYFQRNQITPVSTIEEDRANASDMGSIGAMRDDADLLELVTRDIMESRLTRTLRHSPDA